MLWIQLPGRKLRADARPMYPILPAMEGYPSLSASPALSMIGERPSRATGSPESSLAISVGVIGDWPLRHRACAFAMAVIYSSEKGAPATARVPREAAHVQQRRVLHAALGMVPSSFEHFGSPTGWLSTMTAMLQGFGSLTWGSNASSAWMIANQARAIVPIPIDLPCSPSVAHTVCIPSYPSKSDLFPTGAPRARGALTLGRPFDSSARLEPVWLWLGPASDLQLLQRWE